MGNSVCIRFQILFKIDRKKTKREQRSPAKLGCQVGCCTLF